MLSLLQTRRDWPGGVLAERLEVSGRTVRRDVDRLRELGYRIEAVKGPDGGYRLEAGADLPPLLFDDEQAVALAVALQLAATAGTGVEEGALRALTTMRQVMPSRIRHRLDALPLVAVRAPGRQAEVDSAVLVALGGAVHAREVLRFTYDGADAVRRAEPHHLATWQGRWYLVAWDLDREDWRTFRADRLALRIPNGPRFAPRDLPEGDVTSFLVARFRGATGSTAWPYQGEVVLDLPAADVVPYVGDGTVEDLGDGRTRVVTGSWSWTGLAASLLRFDAPVEVVGPPELSEAFRTLAERCAAAARGSSRRG